MPAPQTAQVPQALLAPAPKSPFVVDKFMAYMKGAGINVQQDGKKLKEGDWVSLNGSTGALYKGEVEQAHAHLLKDWDRRSGRPDTAYLLEV